MGESKRKRKRARELEMPQAVTPPHPPPHPPPPLEATQGQIVESISHTCYLQEVAFEWKLTKETIYLPRGCLQGGSSASSSAPSSASSLASGSAWGVQGYLVHKKPLAPSTLQ